MTEETTLEVEDTIVEDQPAPDQQSDQDADNTPSSSDGEPDTGAETSDGEADATAKPEKKGIQKRIDELVKKGKTAEYERDFYKEQFEKASANKPQQPAKGEDPKPDDAIPPMPSEYDFNSREEYQKAVSERDQKLIEFAANRAAQSASEAVSSNQRQADQRKAQSNFEARVDKLAETHPDAKLVVFDDRLPLTAEMGEIIVQSEKGAEIAYHLGLNPKEAQRIAGLSPLQQARELGIIESTVGLPQSRTVSNAPTPIKPVGGSGGSSRPDPSKESMEDYVTRRRKERGAQ